MERSVLNNGVQIPVIGMGTYQLTGKKMAAAAFLAVRAGYRAFDTSSAYANEKYLGLGLRLSGVSRKDLFLSSKISNQEQKTLSVQEAYHAALHKMGLKYLDLYLLHWPVPETFLATWRGMEELYLSGQVRAIGVCNCHKHHLEDILKIAKVPPMIDQIELHPLLSQKPLTKFCSENNIKVQAYTPLARMDRKLLENDVLRELSNQYHHTIPQIILRWDYQCGVIPIPKSKAYVRMKENIKIFDFSLSQDDMHRIDAINQDYRVRFDPDHCDFNKL